jgi:hypothetical protein
MKKFIRRGISYLQSHGYDLVTVRQFELAAADAQNETEIASLIAEITDETVSDVESWIY